MTGPAIDYDPDRIYKTAHWVDDLFYPRTRDRQAFFKGQVSDTDMVLLYAGRLSEEKGVFDLPVILAHLQKSNVHVTMVIAGTGPARDRLKKELPDAVFLGWVDKTMMPDLYSQVDLLILPSRFDTFGNVILEAMSCGAAVAAYAEKGPLEIIQTEDNGILSEDLAGLADGITRFVRDETFCRTLKKNSLARSRAFSSTSIFDKLLLNLGLAGADQSPEKQKQVSPKPSKDAEDAAFTETLKAAIGY
ncbi:MAG: glycosyltransferase [Desulfobacteraceae bacterium]|nr:glycosyltransferase [Desulfobacteraceae bacterium]